MRIFLTGGTGFIGKFVIQKLNNGTNHLLVLTRNPDKQLSSSNVSFLRGSLEDISEWEKALEKFKPEAAIHLAWEGIPDYGVENSIKNLKYGLELIQLLTKVNCKKILATGSVWEYGKIPGKLSEDLPVEPFNCFTAAKNSLSWMGREIAEENNINFIWTRLFYVYGPGQKETSLISYLIRCIKEGKKPAIRNPLAQNDFIYVEDVADAIVKLILNYHQSDIFNIGSGELSSVHTIINKIYEIFGKEKDYQLSEKVGTDTLSASFADISKIEKQVGWRPQTDIDEGIKKTIDNFSLS